VVGYGAPPAEAPVVAGAASEADEEPTTAPVARYWAWADLMRAHSTSTCSRARAAVAAWG
jgi:hypothetical protein